MAIKPKNSGSLTRTQTASWQHDSMDLADGMDNKDHPSYKALTSTQAINMVVPLKVTLVVVLL